MKKKLMIAVIAVVAASLLVLGGWITINRIKARRNTAAAYGTVRAVITREYTHAARV
ncbi:MAG: hypothetical protein Q4G19_01675 [Clostridia bacterium]|nr:hypothetical protein [Clostridia bacterium]